MEDPQSHRGAGGSSVGPHGAPDPNDAFITVQMPSTEIFDAAPEEAADPDPTVRIDKKPHWFKRHPSSSKPKQTNTIGVRMRRSEFLSYFVKDRKTDQYREGVVVPPGRRKQWLQKRLHDQQTGELDETTRDPDRGGPTASSSGFADKVRVYGRNMIDTVTMQAGVVPGPHSISNSS